MSGVIGFDGHLWACCELYFSMTMAGLNGTKMCDEMLASVLSLLADVP